VSIVAKTAAGGSALSSEALAFGSSLHVDLRLFRADLLGSAAHATMLGETGIIPRAHAATLRNALLALETSDPAMLPAEEDVHMAVEAHLAQSKDPAIAAAASYLHTARSRNDQVATTLRLYARDACVARGLALLTLVESLVLRARREGHMPMPSYTHRQRAQAISFGFWLLAYAEMFLRDAQLWLRAAESADVCPLGSGAIAGTTLPIDRARTADLLGFASLSSNALDAVGDRDFILDINHAAARFATHVSRMAADVIDFSTAEFGFFELGGAIASGSSMMPQKRNPDVFELLRGRSAACIGALVQSYTLMKGLPAGYNRDMQEDRGPLYAALDETARSSHMLAFALGHVRVRHEHMARGLADGSTQATDVAEALVRAGVPFREAYQVVGKLVHLGSALKVPLTELPIAAAAAVDARVTMQILAHFSAERAPERRTVLGGPSSTSCEGECVHITQTVANLRSDFARRKTLDHVSQTLATANTP
jgi:argininosuccinate lyase